MEKGRGIEYEPGRFTARPSDEEIIEEMAHAVHRTRCDREDRLPRPHRAFAEDVFAAIRAYEKAKQGG